MAAAKATTLVLSFAAFCLPVLANVPRASLVAEKPHLGGPDFALISHQGLAAANVLIAPGIARCLCDGGRRSRSTGKERDAETGLDYFGARYFSAAQGRFTSPDGPLIDQTTDDPQSWNLYSYVRNNPLIFTDPTGNDCVYVNSGGSGIDSVNNQNTSKQCGKTGGYWVDGTVTDARFAHGSLILTGTTDGTNRTSASYGLGPTFGDQFIGEMGRRQDASNRVIAIAATPYVALATSYAAVYALPELLAGLSSSEVGAIGGSIAAGIKLGGKFLKINPNVPLRALLKGARLAKGDGFQNIC